MCIISVCIHTPTHLYIYTHTHTYIYIHTCVVLYGRTYVAFTCPFFMNKELIISMNCCALSYSEEGKPNFA